MKTYLNVIASLTVLAAALTIASARQSASPAKPAAPAHRALGGQGTSAGDGDTKLPLQSHKLSGSQMLAFMAAFSELKRQGGHGGHPADVDLARYDVEISAPEEYKGRMAIGVSFTPRMEMHRMPDGTRQFGPIAAFWAYTVDAETNKIILRFLTPP